MEQTWSDPTSAYSTRRRHTSGEPYVVSGLPCGRISPTPYLWSPKRLQRAYPGLAHILHPTNFVPHSSVLRLGYPSFQQGASIQCTNDVGFVDRTLFYSDITPFIPVLLTLMTPAQLPPNSVFDEDEFTLASDALQEILSRSALSDGSGTKVLTEPLLIWLERYGRFIVEQTLNGESRYHLPNKWY